MICTTEVTYNWEVAELHSLYNRQSFIENKWRKDNDPRHYIDALYLQKPARITSLMWLMSMAILLVSGVEWQLNARVDSKKLKLPVIEPGNRAKTLTYDRVHNILRNSYWSIIVMQNRPLFSEINLNIIKMFEALGPSWSKYIDLDYIASKLFKTA